MELKITKCRSCGANIVFITTESGRKMPCNAEAVDYQDNIKGKDLIVTESGKVIKGTIIKPSFNGLVPIIDGKGYISHFATCPFANQHRTRQGGGK